jgi:hypothetical protein
MVKGAGHGATPTVLSHPLHDVARGGVLSQLPGGLRWRRGVCGAVGRV